MKHKIGAALVAGAAALALSQSAFAADWSDTSIGVRYGTKFAEPFGATDIKKTIVNLTHADGDKYGGNFFNVDLLESNKKDAEAQEAYIVYRRLFDFGKISGKNFAYGPVRGMGLTVGFDWNTKNDPGYASKKRMLVVGPTFMFDVPGFWDVSLVLLEESNKPVGITSRYTYKTHPALMTAWGIPLGSGFSFEGYTNWIASKGTNEFGGPTAAEFNFDGQVMYDLGVAMGAAKNTFKVGLEYQYWRNKFGNPYKGFAGPGAFAKTPMIRAEYHF